MNFNAVFILTIFIKTNLLFTHTAGMQQLKIVTASQGNIHMFEKVKWKMNFNAVFILTIFIKTILRHGHFKTFNEVIVFWCIL
jgi:hypothetical protein